MAWERLKSRNQPTAVSDGNNARKACLASIKDDRPRLWRAEPLRDWLIWSASCFAWFNVDKQGVAA